jgi:NAD(P)H-hydrate epimerase
VAFRWSRGGVEILTSDEMRQVDRRAAGVFGIPEIVLMENAGLRLFDALRALYPDLARRRLLLLCGRGNNGGDTLVLARHLSNAGVPFRTLLFGRPGELRGSAGINLDAARRLGIEVRPVPGASHWRKVRGWLRDADLMVDGILGTGLSRPVAGFLARVFGEVNETRADVVAVDIPSGLSGDSAAIPGPAIAADHTVTFCRPKVPHVFPPGRDRCGRVLVADISIPPAAVAARGPGLELLRPAGMRALLPRRAPDGHKGDYGHVLVIAGSRGKGGAARMAALGALRAGCGLVTAAVPASLVNRLLPGAMEVMTEPLDETAEGTIAWSALPRLLALAEGKRAVALGPGLTTHPETKKLVRALARRVRVPMVIDADGLNAFSGEAALIRGRGRALVLTPHPGEMGRLMGRTAAEVQADRVASARALARSSRCHVVLKGHLTLVADPDGKVSANPTGNAGMAKGGSGDVLTGCVAGLMAQGLPAGAAARLGVFVHGLAGDVAAGRTGEMALLPRDILSGLPTAFRRLDTAPADATPFEVIP